MTKLFFLGSPRCGTMALSSSLFWVRVQPCQHFFSSWNTERTRVVRYDRSALYTIGHTHRAPTLCSKLFAGQIVKKKLANLDLSEKTRILDFDNLCIFIVHDHPWSEWPDLAKFRHFGEHFKIFGNFWSVSIIFDKNWTYFGYYYFIWYWANVYCCKWPNIE